MTPLLTSIAISFNQLIWSDKWSVVVQIVRPVINNQQPGHILPEIFFHNHAANFFGNSTSQRVMQIFDNRSIRQSDIFQLSPERIIIICGAGIICFLSQESVRIILIGGATNCEQMVFDIV